MRQKKRSEYKYPPEKMKEWRDNWKSKLTPEQIEERKRKQREFNQKYQERRRHENVRRRSAQPLIPDRKVCGRCKTEKSQEEFRIRTEKRSEPYFDYLNNVCKICDAELTRISYKKTKEKNREKNRLKAIEYYNKNKDRILATEKVRRKKPAYKKYVKDYYNKNKGKIRASAKEVNKKYQQSEKGKQKREEYISTIPQETIKEWANKYARRNREELTDVYVRGALAKLLKIERSEVTSEMIEMYRSYLLLRRVIKKIKTDT